MMTLLTLLSEDKSLTATEVGQNLWLEHGEALPPPANPRQTFINTHAALLGSAIRVCQQQ